MLLSSGTSVRYHDAIVRSIDIQRNHLIPTTFSSKYSADILTLCLCNHIRRFFSLQHKGMPVTNTKTQSTTRRRPRLERLLYFCHATPFILSATCSTYMLACTTTSFSPKYSRVHHHTYLPMVQTSGSKGLSRYFQAILSRTRERQRFVTGKYPVIVSVQENPTQKWLNKDSATSLLLVNDTNIDKSLASYDRFQWLDEVEREELHDRYASVSLELLAEVHMPKPGYVQVLSRFGAGASAEASREYGSTTRWNRWQNSTLYKELFLDELLLRRRHQELPPTKDRLWVTGFSLAGRKGFVKSMDVDSGHIESVNARSEAMTLWPNEVTSVPKRLITPPTSTVTDTTSAWEEDALLVSDGFLVPGKDRGGIYIIKNPGNPYSEWTVSLTDREGERWFYHRYVSFTVNKSFLYIYGILCRRFVFVFPHICNSTRAAWVDLTGDGRKSILTARAKLQKVADGTNDDKTSSLFGGRFSRVNEDERRPKNGQLVWLEMPRPHHFDEATGTPLEEDGTEFDPFSSGHLPWKERVLARGPDVMFNIADMDPLDNTIEVIASQFFDKKVTLHSIKRGPKPKITFSRVIDDRCGAAFGGILADLSENHSEAENPNGSIIIDSGSTVESLKPGDPFTHVLVTSHECNFAESKNHKSSTIDIHDASVLHHNARPTHHLGKTESLDGGSLFTYKVPQGKDAWKTKPWTRTTIASGFKVKGQIWNVINPGAPGFVYTFYAKLDDQRGGKRPLIAVAGDCSESAFIFRPERLEARSTNIADPEAQYKLMCEIKCGATVGSIGVGYDNLCSVEQEPGYAKLYIPCYEKDKILVFALGSGDDLHESDSGEELEWHHAKSVLV